MRIAPAVILTTVLLQAAAVTGSASASATRHCAPVGSSAGAGYGHIRAHGVSCRTARRVLSPNHAPLPGWKIEHHAYYDRFTRGSAWITGVPLGD